MTVQNQRTRFARIDLVLFLFFLAGTLMFFMRPLDDCDILTQIRLGYLGFDEPIKTEPLIYWREGQPIANPNGLAQLVFALLDREGGLVWVRYGYVVLVSFSFLLVLRVTSRTIYRQFSVFSYGFGGFVGILIMLSNSSVRPQGFSLLGCALLFCLHYSGISYFRKLIFLALLGLTWQNLHPSLPIGILVYGLLSLQDFDKERTLSWFWKVCAGGGVLAICCILTPDGFEFLRVSQDNQRISTALCVSEWLPAWSLGVRAAMTPFYFFFALGVITLLVKRKDYKLSEISFFVLFSAMTFYVARFGFYLGLVAVPFFVKTVEQIRPKNLFAWDPNVPVRKIQFIIPGLIYLTLIGGMALYLPSVAPFFPREAIAALKNHPEVTRVFDYREYAGALSYWGDRHWKLFIDGRLYLYPGKIWRVYNGVAIGDEHSLEILCREYRPDALFLRKSFFAGFLSQFKTSEKELCERKWNKIYEDDETIVFILDHDRKTSW